MSTNIKDAKKGNGIPVIEAGTYGATCCAVIDLGVQETSYEGRTSERPQILLIFEIPDEKIQVDGEMKPRWISQTFTFSVHEKSSLRKTLASWRGRDFTESELQNFDIKNVLAAPCMITIKQTEKGGNVYANLSGVGKVLKGLQIDFPTKKWHFDIDNPDTWASFKDFPDWIKGKINSSLTLKKQGIQINADTGDIVRVGNFNTPSDLVEDSEIINDDDLPF